MMKEKRTGIKWIIISGISIAAAVAVMLLGFDTLSVGKEDGKAETEKAESKTESADETKIENETTQDDTAIQQFVSEVHQFYNETTGYGKINRLDWEEQKDQAKQIIHTIETEVDMVEQETLAADLNQIVSLAKLVIQEQDDSNVRQLHRYFHDLDIALNDYSDYKEIWNVTETLNED